ncbi:response regulator transcription factor [Streptomyces somaliensis]|uniref:Response regulator transcription factor n=1 Tax=Streptomyces somaliensis (strain ATCC 33201 / DSM 40738 / JCM 12659 / KCTC 9044 / NCTC 11332 / NRRL B-12077 / IP 733) TaxID=1134445 RepID=A0AA44DE50_STRE0|nr:response regulator transcription factor [Streptomyces somaliensis]MCP9944043.1 response regulator transcription factor [Streptomyces somaliensis]MCP9962717.1 response regulator transcription factor [Streptomyces somaliensis]MCP9975552.1 response regulator transcription factor [Streptomyces somaliensis]MCQ0023005.1 response regulator transcription factor [Streptomyces somaliensis DSM 40738]NKY14730.1 response regulator transcription factor [Streptomyces somaliensis DSM 40738]
MARVLLIEDDLAVQKGVTLALKRRGHGVEVAGSGETGLLALDRHRPDLVLLDLMLPGMSGLEVCRRIRESRQVPIIILSARGDDVDMVVGLEAGADDYIVKPAGGEVLEARIRAVLRRVAPAQDGGSAAPAAGGERHGALVVDRAALIVTRDGTELALAPSELKLLLFLSASPGRVYSRQQLLEQVWEHSFYGDARLVDACVMRLRGKVEEDPRAPVYVQTVRGFGYRFGPLP